jgi:Ecdysteroid kinase-like family
MNVIRCVDFPSDPDGITPAWVEQMLASNQIVAPVATVSHGRIGTGQIGQNHRYSIEYSDPVAARLAGAPESLVGKFVSPDPVSRGTGLALGIYQKEAAFYRILAPRVAATMRIAKAWVSEFDADREATLVLMEDLAPAVQADQMAGCSVATAEQAVRQLAVLHATFWEHDLLRSDSAEFGSMMNDPHDEGRAQFVQYLLSEHWPLFIERYVHRLTPEMVELGNVFAAQIGSWIQARTSPVTLTHNDYRADNLMVHDDWTAAVDWQTVGVGYAGTDLGYFLGASLLPDDRRAHQDRLLDVWLAELGQIAGTLNVSIGTYDRVAAWDDYRHGQFAGFTTAVVSSMITQRTDRGDEMFWTMASRHLTAAIETNAADLLS